MYCSTCGYQNRADANYCAKCGNYLAEAVGAQETAPMSLPGVGRDSESDVTEPAAGHGCSLVIRSGGGRAGERFRVLAQTTIGRSPANDIFLDDVTVSREHAVVYSSSDGTRIEDRKSLNGTYVNHERIERSALADGDEIQIGKYKLTFMEK